MNNDPTSEKPRECPRCNAPMGKVQVSVTIDRCEKCAGEFYDAGEVEVWSTARHPEEVSDSLGQQLSRHRLHPSSVHCPACHAGMMQCAVEHGQDRVVVDHCQGCSGLWLDAGEPEKLRHLLLAISGRSDKTDGGADAGASGFGHALRMFASIFRMS